MGAENLIRCTDQGRCTRTEPGYLRSDLRPTFGSTCGETRSGWRTRNPGQQSNWSFWHPQGGQVLLKELVHLVLIEERVVQRHDFAVADHPPLQHVLVD